MTTGSIRYDTLLRILSSIIDWGLRPTASAEEIRQHHYTSHGIIAAIVQIIFSIPIIEALIQWVKYADRNDLSYYRIPLFAHSLLYIFLLVTIQLLRRFSAWHTALTFSGNFVMFSFHITMSLLLGIGAGFHYVQLALLPLSFLAFPRRIPLAILLFAINLGAWLTLQLGQTRYRPPYPVPQSIENPLRLGLGFLAAFLFCAQLIYFGMLTDFFARLAEMWRKIGRVGAERFGTEAEKQNNAISNQVIITFVMVMCLLVLLQIAFTSVLLIRDFSQYRWYPPVYILPSLGYAFLLYKLFRWKNQANNNTLYETVAYFTGLAFVAMLAIVQGRDVFIYFALLPLIPVPAFFSAAGPLLKNAFALSAAALFYVCHRFVGKGMFPLPPDMNHEMGILVIGVTVLIFAVTTFYLWIKSEMTTRILRWWRKISEYGIDQFNDPQDRKYAVVGNQLILFFVSQMVLYLGTVAVLSFYVFSLVDSPWKTISAYLALGFACQFLLLASFWIKKRIRHRLVMAFPFAVGHAFVMLLSAFLGSNANIHLYLFLFVILPFFIFTPEQKFFVLLAGLFTLFCAIAMNLWHQSHVPIFPMPDSLYGTISGILTVFLSLGLISTTYYLWRESHSTERNLEGERKKSDQLLLNILPQNVANELKDKGHTTPILFQSATVFFTDFVGFTSIAETLSPGELVAELDNCFSYFDHVCARYNLEKLKTIGDSFMAVGGIPVPNNTHAIDCCLAAMEIRSFMAQMKEIKENMGLPYWQLRIGISSGNLVAGVVGEKKFAYDVWGDTVNIASRMESSGVPGMINISEATYQQVRFLFDCEARGRVRAKNKGEIAMYFLNGLKKRYSENGDGRVPNAEFRVIYEKIAAGARLIPRSQRAETKLRLVRGVA